MKESHVYPVNDLKPHFERDCECKPVRRYVDGKWKWYHRAFDGRELKDINNRRN
jgi:hypothetical protein